MKIFTASALVASSLLSCVAFARSAPNSGASGAQEIKAGVVACNMNGDESVINNIEIK